MNLVIKKEFANDRSEQPGPDYVVTKTNGKNWVRDPYYFLHLEKNNNL